MKAILAKTKSLSLAGPSAEAKMPPRIDPYANKTHKRIDIFLVVITLVLMIFAFRASAQHRAMSNESARAAQAQATSHK